MKKGRSTERKEHTHTHTHKKKGGGFERPCMLLRYKKKKKKKKSINGNLLASLLKAVQHVSPFLDASGSVDQVRVDSK